MRSKTPWRQKAPGDSHGDGVTSNVPPSVPSAPLVLSTPTAVLSAPVVLSAREPEPEAKQRASESDVTTRTVSALAPHTTTPASARTY
ncbi:MAG: hypothetical protein MHM6MM_005668 [Cercozoa sp. M6MM]